MFQFVTPEKYNHEVVIDPSFRGDAVGIELWCALFTPETLEIPGLVLARIPE
jgi:hypothetical protein